VTIVDALSVVQIILAILLIIAVLMQAKGSAGGGIFGGDASAVYHTRRGFERRLFQFTIVLAVVFFFIALTNSLVSI
jgi:preprotein translocase subunit SecG